MAVPRKNSNSQETVEECFVQYIVCLILVNRVLGVDFCPQNDYYVRFIWLTGGYSSGSRGYLLFLF